MVKKILQRLRSRVFEGLATKADLEVLYDQIAGLSNIQNAMAGRPVLRPLRGWAISPDSMSWILAEIQERTAPVAIEFGCGQSTIILAAALREQGGSLWSVEHDPAFAEAIKKQLDACGLGQQVQFIILPLSQAPGTPPICSYDTSMLPAMSLDLALVDGPPYFNGPLTRLGPLRWVAAHLKAGGVIFLDDAKRGAEHACLDHLEAEYPDLQRTDRKTEKGLCELRSRQRALAATPALSL